MPKVEKYVYEDTSASQNGKKRDKPFRGEFVYKNTRHMTSWYKSIKEAQIQVDIKRIELGLKPNILTKKTTTKNKTL